AVASADALIGCSSAGDCMALTFPGRALRRSRTFAGTAPSRRCKRHEATADRITIYEPARRPLEGYRSKERFNYARAPLPAAGDFLRARLLLAATVAHEASSPGSRLRGAQRLG